MTRRDYAQTSFFNEVAEGRYRTFLVEITKGKTLEILAQISNNKTILFFFCFYQFCVKQHNASSGSSKKRKKTMKLEYLSLNINLQNKQNISNKMNLLM